MNTSVGFEPVFVLPLNHTHERGHYLCAKTYILPGGTPRTPTCHSV